MSDPTAMIKSRVLSAVSALFVCIFSICSARAMNTLLTDFVEASNERVEALAPSLVAAYPRAHFVISGFSSPFGDWAFIRAEDVNSCENDLCPTVIVVEKTEWKVLIVAKKQIETSTTLENGGVIRCKLISNGGVQITFRYVNGEKTLYIGQ